jgi:CRP/FNR family transcriptional regulator, cyclic AMP receptor protein
MQAMNAGLKHAHAADCAVFRGLTDEERAALVARAPVKTFRPGQTIFLMGSPGESMMVVLSGNVRISVSSPEGKELMLTIVRPGEMFGEIALLDRKERTADATAMTACRLAILERRQFLAFLEANPGILLRIVDVLCGRLRHTDQHIGEVALLPMPARIAKALLRLTAGDARSADDGGSPQIRLSQRELGMIVGTSRERINKYLRAWQGDGVIRMKRSTITLLNRAALGELAELGEHQLSRKGRAQEIAAF